MKLHSVQQNEAILSNVGEIGEFRIRNSAKAFSILSSGLYANKIRAIVRELSCNAVDSHTAAGKADTPFDVHLPNQLEPWFSIRDYGTGLSHDQVTNIYTTYFESTKTNSNDFIGALGLGSKSPFSYTDNFTVTAIQAGRKGVYSAFINDQGVPSIALMMEEETTDPNGVEVKFSVNDRYDFNKFVEEARYVYTWFKLKPVITGVSDFKFRELEYDKVNIVPGASSYKSGSPHGSRSVAVMGNIAYPIEIPNADQTLGNLRQLLGCGLELTFNIGELDFQASREGLSYIPETIEAIKSKLEQVNTALASVLAKDADAIPNLWDRAIFLYEHHNSYLWQAAVIKYATDTKLVTFDVSNNHYQRTRTFEMPIDVLAKKFNIEVNGFEYFKGNRASASLKSSTRYSDNRNASGHYDITHYWGFHVDDKVHFVVNDTNIGAVERAKFHYKESGAFQKAHVFVLNRVDKTKEMNLKAFYKAIGSPRDDRKFVVSSFLKKERVSGMAKNVTILKLDERGYGGYYRQKEMVWKDAGKANTFNDNQIYYYMPLSGYTPEGKDGYVDMKRLYNDLRECGMPNLKQDIYGVRKGDIEFIKTQKNWVNIETYIAQELAKPIDQKLVMSLVLERIDGMTNFNYNLDIIDAKSPYKVFVNKLKGYEKVRYNSESLRRLCSMYAKNVQFNPEAQVNQYYDEAKAVQERYPLLAYLRSVPSIELQAYINMIDTQKGV